MTASSDLSDEYRHALTLAVVTWLDLNYPKEDHCEPGWVLSSMIESRYLGGMAQFMEDFNGGTSVS